MFNRLKRKIGVALIAVSAAITNVIAVGAEGTETLAEGGLSPEVQAQIQSQFTNMGDDIMAVIVPIIGIGLGIFALILGIKFGKKMFKTVSNG